MYLTPVRYTSKKINIKSPDINTDLAFATKHKLWSYENEVRLINYNPNTKEEYYGIPLDEKSEIEAIYFGYDCPQSTIYTICDLFEKSHTQKPKFYKIEVNKQDVYNMTAVEYYRHTSE